MSVGRALVLKQSNLRLTISSDKRSHMDSYMETKLQRILIVDDDVGLAELMIEHLKNNAFTAQAVGNGGVMREQLLTQPVDLIILDIMLPGEDGLSLLRWLRENNGPPVIMVSARGEEVDKVIGLEMGADDYLAKPFSPRELIARIRAVLRRSVNKAVKSATPVYSFGSFQLNTKNHSLLQGEQEVSLTTGEYNLLQVFVENPDQVLTRDQLIGLLKGFERSPYDRSIDIRVTRLRRKIEPHPDKPVFIRTVWGAGYLFSPTGSGHES